jgi:hypothetical protein
MTYDNPHRDLACGVSELQKRGCAVYRTRPEQGREGEQG